MEKKLWFLPFSIARDSTRTECLACIQVLGFNFENTTIRLRCNIHESKASFAELIFSKTTWGILFLRFPIWTTLQLNNKPVW